MQTIKDVSSTELYIKDLKRLFDGFPFAETTRIRAAVLAYADSAHMQVEERSFTIGFTSRHVRYMTATGNADKCWRSLYTYTKMDIPCAEVPGLGDIMQRIMLSIVDIIGEMYKKPQEAFFLRPRSWKEPHLLMYQKVRGKTPHTGVEMHYDGCHLTTQIMLSDRSEYQGGGTYFRALRKTIKLSKGQVLVHPGDLYHKGVDISKGERKMIVCFMDGFKPDIHDKSLESDDRKEYEENVIET